MSGRKARSSLPVLAAQLWRTNGHMIADVAKVGWILPTDYVLDATSFICLTQPVGQRWWSAKRISFVSWWLRQSEDPGTGLSVLRWFVRREGCSRAEGSFLSEIHAGEQPQSTPRGSITTKSQHQFATVQTDDQAAAGPMRNLWNERTRRHGRVACGSRPQVLPRSEIVRAVCARASVLSLQQACTADHRRTTGQEGRAVSGAI